MIVEQAPLLTRARKRRRPFSLYESKIARCILRCAGGYYGKSQLVSDAKKGSLALGWPQPTVPVPTADNLELGLTEVSSGIASLPQFVSKWYGVDREQAFVILEQIQDDNAEMKKRVPELWARLNPVAPDEDNEGQGNSDQSNNKTTDDLSGNDEDNQSRDTKELIVDL